MKSLLTVLPLLTLSAWMLPPQASAQSATAAPAKAASQPRPRLARSAIKAVEERTPVDDDVHVDLSPEELDIAKRVHVGTMPCELGASVTITPSTRREGFFVVQTKTVRYYMHPAESRTGAIRLEDPKRGALWLQLGNKSMLMSQKLGARLADDCMSAPQVAFAEQMKKNPARSVLDGPEPARAPAAPAALAAPAAPQDATK